MTLFFFHEPSISDNGTAAVDYLDSLDDARYNIGITAPGIYYFTAEATDVQSNTYTDTLAVVVYDQATLAASLRQKWTGMQQALIDFNIPAAVKYFITGRRDAYNEVFQVYAGQIKDKLPSAQNMELLEINGQKAKFIVDFTVEVNGQSTTFSTYVIFDLDSDGLWKISFF